MWLVAVAWLRTEREREGERDTQRGRERGTHREGEREGHTERVGERERDCRNWLIRVRKYFLEEIVATALAENWIEIEKCCKWSGRKCSNWKANICCYLLEKSCD